MHAANYTLTMNNEIKQQLERLGGQLTFTRSTTELLRTCSWYNVESYESWEIKDPAGQLTELPEAICQLASLQWTRRAFGLLRDEERQTVELCGASENLDVQLEGERLLLYQIGWNQDSQYLYCLNALNQEANPPVYTIEHDGSEPYLYCNTLSAFLEALFPK